MNDNHWFLRKNEGFPNASESKMMVAASFIVNPVERLFNSEVAEGVPCISVIASSFERAEQLQEKYLARLKTYYEIQKQDTIMLQYWVFDMEAVKLPQMPPNYSLAGAVVDDAVFTEMRLSPLWADLKESFSKRNSHSILSIVRGILD